MASGEGHANVVSLLLSKAPHQVDAKNKLGRTAFHLAASSGRNNVVTQLLAQGAQIDAEDTVNWVISFDFNVDVHSNVIRHNNIRHNIIRHNIIRHNVIRHNL